VIFALIPVLVLLGITEVLCRNIGRIEFLRKHLLGGSNPGFVWPETPIHETAEMTTDPYSGYRLAERPGAATRRPPRIPVPAKAPGTIRAVVMGDSVPHGHSLAEEKAWPGRLEYYLNKWAPKGTKFEVYNLGVPGFNPQQTKRLLQSRYMQLKPDIVLWHEQPEIKDQLELPELGSSAWRWVQSMLLRSKLIHLMVTLHNRDKHASVGHFEEIWMIYNAPYYPVPEGDLVGFEAFVSWLKERGVKAVIGVPQIYMFLDGKTAQSGKIEVSTGPWVDMRLPYINSTAVFKVEEESAASLFVDNCHFSAKGADLLARTTSEYMESNWSWISSGR